MKNTETIFFKAQDGVILNGIMYKNTNKTAKIIISVHGMATNCIKKRDEIIAQKANEINIDFLAFNNRGHDLVNYIKKESKEKPELAGTAYEEIAESYEDIVGAINYAIEQGYKEIYIIGQVGMHYFEHRNVEFSHSFKYTIQNPTLSRARSIAETLLDSYLRDKVDEVYIIYTKMINSMSSEAEMLKLLPMDKGDFKTDELLETGERTEYEFMPSSDVVFDTIVPNWLSGLVYGALVEAYCSEQNSRMMAMQSSTDNANEMLRDLNVVYNRVRQAAITQEITEVISGAKAQKSKKS